MFRRIADFETQWKHEAESTLRVLRSLTDASLSQPIVAGGRTLGFLAWHLTIALPVQAAQAGIEIEGPTPTESVPSRAADIAAGYQRASASLLERAPGAWSDEALTESVGFFGRPMPLGLVLEWIIRHQAHHRGQMTVLMRQAGAPVPGMYGPSKEEWGAMGMPARH